MENNCIYLSSLKELCDGLLVRCPDCGHSLRYSIQFDLVHDDFLISVDCPDCEWCSDVELMNLVSTNDFRHCVFLFLNRNY